MNEELRKKLADALSKKGLSKELVNLINITEESQIEGVVDTLGKLQNAKQDPISLDEYLKANPNAKSEIDRRVTKGIETFNKNKKEEGADPKKDDDNPWKVAFEKLDAKLDGLAKQKEDGDKLSQATSILGKSEVIPKNLTEKWIKRIDLDSDTSFEDQVKGLETEYTDLRQDFMKGAVDTSGMPIVTNDDEPSDSEIDDIIG